MKIRAHDIRKNLYTPLCSLVIFGCDYYQVFIFMFSRNVMLGSAIPSGIALGLRFIIESTIVQMSGRPDDLSPLGDPDLSGTICMV